MDGAIFTMIKRLVKIILLVIILAMCKLSFSEILPGNYKQNVLIEHNKWRVKHHSPKLMWDETLAEYAENYAQHCKFQHSGGPYGENLGAGYPSVAVVIDAWYAENEKYSYERPGFSMRTGHFTQMIWKATTKVGCGYAVCNGKNGTPGTFWVCEYLPRGNVTNQGYFEENVLRE